MDVNGLMTCAYAAQNGHLEVLQWARQNGCEWTSLTCTYAAENGHLEVLQWARSPFSVEDRKGLRGNENLQENFCYLDKNGCE